jgi:hypothetical protein
MLNLITVVGRNIKILPHMLKYYENIVDDVYVIVYRENENDGILESVLELGIKPYMVVNEPNYHWNRIADIYNEVKNTKPNDWWIVANEDEFHVYPYDVKDIIKECEENNFTFVTGGLLDRVGNDGILVDITKDTNIFEAFPHAGFFTYPVSNACPNKVTLMKGSQDLSSGQHYAIWGTNKNSWGRWHRKRMPIDVVFAQVHKFNWDATVKSRLEHITQDRIDYVYVWEFEKIYNDLKINNFRFDLNNSEYLFEKLKNISYITYTDYSKWDLLRDKIVTI